MAGKLDYTAETGGKSTALHIGETALTVGGRELPYHLLDSFKAQNYRIQLRSGGNSLELMRMGHDLEPFMFELARAYNDLLAKALFIEGEPLIEVFGEYCYREEGKLTEGEAYLRIYDGCVCIFPTDSGGRRIPLCFITEIKPGNYRLKITLDTGEWYEFIRLGRDTDNFERVLRACMENLFASAAAYARSLCPSLLAGQANAIAALTPQGAAATLSALSEISPDFVPALEAKIADSRAAETYAYFREVCAPADILAGVKAGLAGAEGDIIWVAARRGGFAAVELALPGEASAATYIYRAQGGDFFTRLNHAMEAISFRREIITISEQDAASPDKAHYAMALSRTAYLRFLRGCLAGRVIHHTADSWRRDMEKYFL